MRLFPVISRGHTRSDFISDALWVAEGAGCLGRRRRCAFWCYNRFTLRGSGVWWSECDKHVTELVSVKDTTSLTHHGCKKNDNTMFIALLTMATESFVGYLKTSVIFFSIWDVHYGTFNLILNPESPLRHP